VDLTNAQWRKSSYSGTNGGNCVEVALNLPGVVAVRDSKNPDSEALSISPHQWHTLLASIRSGAMTASASGLRSPLTRTDSVDFPTARVRNERE
jgi:hypothetical protein